MIVEISIDSFLNGLQLVIRRVDDSSPIISESLLILRFVDSLISCFVSFVFFVFSVEFLNVCSDIIQALDSDMQDTITQYFNLLDKHLRLNFVA